MESASCQNVIVMRHGDRIDNFEPFWTSTAARPWDPPLVEAGFVRAFCTGKKLQPASLGYPIHRVFVSPFLRCVQTASEVASALCSPDDDNDAATSSRELSSLDPSKVKVAIENGLCEMINREAIRLSSAPEDGDFGFRISELEALLPDGTVDHSFKPVYAELPKWEETVVGARTRYVEIIKTLADKYPSENLLLVTHGEGVGMSVSGFFKNVTVYEVDYCAFSELRRPISFGKDQSFEAGEFEVLTKPGRTGIGFGSYDMLNGSISNEVDPISFTKEGLSG